MSILDSLLRKKKIDISKASPEEKATFERWKKVLSEADVTVEKILEFCQIQKSLVERQFDNLDNNASKNDRLILLHSVYSKIISLISGPKAEKENLERYLNGLISEIDSANT